MNRQISIAGLTCSFNVFFGSLTLKVTSCAHVFCKACLISFSTSLGKVTCPTCSKLLTVDWTTKADTEHQARRKTTIKGFKASSILNRIKLDDFQTSTKIEALVCNLEYLQPSVSPPNSTLVSFFGI